MSVIESMRESVVERERIERILSPGERRTPYEREIDAEVLARVKAGIAFLEETVGPDWVDRINLDELELQDGDHCVCGQVFAAEVVDIDGWNGYDFACGKFEWSDHGASLGFSREHTIYRQGAWMELQRAWTHVLTPLVQKR